MDEERLTRSYTWEPVAAVVCFVGAALSLVIGFVLTTAWLVNAQRHPFLHGVGLTLLIIGLPILILGGHCLDLNDRRASFRRTLSRPVGPTGTEDKQDSVQPSFGKVRRLR